jgi:hypothetical protein
MSTSKPDFRTALATVADRWLPRLLTSACRDSTSPLHGCFDRDWWHYRIRDFPSIILQQGALALHAAAQLKVNAREREGLQSLAAAACRFWNQRAQRRGAFEEYYPWEQGYPPLAFGTLAVMKLAAAGVVPTQDVRAGAEIACAQLRRRFEGHAANQQIAGLAALAWIKRLFPDLLANADFDTLVTRSLALQTEEGWFVEYGGPDLGYLSVTVDCLWDLADATNDLRFHASVERAIDCLQTFTAVTPGRSLGMHNARNTDYLVPYGLVRAALQLPRSAPAAKAILHRLFAHADTPQHFLGAIDDRYISHYIGQSVMRAALLLEQAPGAEFAPVDLPTRIRRLTASGHWLQVEERRSLIVSLRKGGILTMGDGVRGYSDFGWTVTDGHRQWISHWWSDAWRIGEAAGLLTVEGQLVEHVETSVTPLKHLVLRCLSFAFGRHLISALKRRLIFEKTSSKIGFRREIRIADDSLQILDRFTNLPESAQVITAPRSSKRHVASADSFHPEDLGAGIGLELQRTYARQSNLLTVTTVIKTPP